MWMKTSPKPEKEKQENWGMFQGIEKKQTGNEERGGSEIL